MESGGGKRPSVFTRWQPGTLDAVRNFLLSGSFQSAVQLTAGVLFVSLFVFVDVLRFPGSCVAILLYFVVAVTAAPDCHIGTRIFLCGFMIGPMWLSLLLGGVIATLGKLAPTREGQLIILCVLGPLALVPFAANRVGTSHLYMFAMGLVSCLYLGMPILAGWSAPDITTLWTRAVGFVLVAALIGMFAGSVLSMIVLPSLASHKLEDEVSTALKLMGQHLSCSASLLWRPGQTSLQALPRHLEGLHPLLLPSSRSGGLEEVAPGLLDQDPGAAAASPRQVYAAVMDWFEHLSRPPSDSAATRSKSTCLTGCRSVSSSGSERINSTFYGPTASSMAAAVAAAASDVEEDQQWQQHLQDLKDQPLQDTRTHSWAGATPSAPSSTMLSPRARRQHSTPAQHVVPPATILENPAQLRLGSTVTAAAVKAAKTEVLQAKGSAPAPGSSSGDPSRGPPSSSGGRMLGVTQPCPSISGVRQLLAHAHQLLEAAGTEPQWLRHGERHFHVAPWTKLVAATQLVALRLTALDLIQRDFVSLDEELHSFPVPELSTLLQQLYGTAAAALALLAEQIRCREQPKSVCAASQQILKHPDWRASRQQLLQLLEATLVSFFVRIQQASTDDPVTVPSAHWVRRWMFFHTTTLSLMDALDALANAAEAALTTQPHRSRHWWQLWRQPASTMQQQQQEKGQSKQPSHQETGSGADIEAGVKGAQESHRPVPSAAAAASDGGVATAAGVAHHAPQQSGFPAQQLPGSGQQQQGASAGTAAAGTSARMGVVTPPAAAAAAVAQPVPSWGQRLQAGFLRHTAWVRPWLPLALNVKQYENIKSIVQQLPATFSSREALLGALRNRRVQAAIKYWGVLMVMMVGTLLLMYFVPVTAFFGPSFGYTLAAVGMSDRVESTVFKIAVWTGATFVGATLGWALMVHPYMALNSVALCAVMCAVAFCVGTLPRGHDSSSSLLSLFTLTTLASIVLCQCCGRVGSDWVSIMRGASVLVAAVIALAVQNLVLPWYTSTWALEQLGVVYREATEVLADLVCQLYEDAEQLLQQQEQIDRDYAAKQQQRQQDPHVGGVDAVQEPGTALGPGATAAGGAAGEAVAAGEAGCGAAVGSSRGSLVRSPLQRLQQLDEAVRRVWDREQQAQQQQDERGRPQTGGTSATVEQQQQQQHEQDLQQERHVRFERQPSLTASVAAIRLASIGRLFTKSSAQLQDLLQPSQTAPSPAAAATAEGSHVHWPGSLRPTKSTAGSLSAASGDETAAATAVETAITAEGTQHGEEAVCEMVQLLQQRRLKCQQQGQQQQQQGGQGQGGGVRRVAVTGLQLQARLVRPLVQVKISLVLDTTAWRTGPLATPPLVQQLLQGMFNLADALAALQQAVSIPVQQLSGSWDWMLLHAAGSWAAMLMQAMQLADATAAHVLAPSEQTAQDLLTQIQEVQHKRFEHFAVQRELRRLLYTAIVTDKGLAESHLLDGEQGGQLQGQLRYSACVYATGKVLDQITATARCALQQGCK